MKNLKAKLRKDGGFTLIEMLIVVAIIAILIAVSIPMVGSALENARKATDAANERAFKSALVSSYLLDQAGMAEGSVKVEASDDTNSHIYAYDSVNGAVKASDGVTVGYGQSTGKTGSWLFGAINKNGEVKMMWATTPPANWAAITDNCVSKDMVTSTSPAPANP